jgi:hypothetical protein
MPMRRTKSAGSFLPDKINLSGKKNERSSDGNVAKDTLSLLLSSKYSVHSGVDDTKSTGGKDDLQDELLNLTPGTRKKKLSLLQNFRRRMELLNDSDHPNSVGKNEGIPVLPSALSLTSKTSDKSPQMQMKEKHEEKDKQAEEGVSGFDDPADSEAITKSLGQKMLKGFSKRLKKMGENGGNKVFLSNLEPAGATEQRTTNSEDFVVKAITKEMADSKSAWIEIAFEDLVPGDKEEHSESSAIPKQTERGESTEPTGVSSFARRQRRSRSVGTSPHCTMRKTATADNLNVEETNSTTKGTNLSGTGARQGRSNRSVSLSRRSPHRLRDRTLRVATSSKSPSQISGTKSTSQTRTRNRVGASPRSSHSRRMSLPTISLDDEPKPPDGNGQRAGRRKSSTRSSYEASPGALRRRKKLLVAAGGDGTEDENVPREISRSPGSYSQRRPTSSTGSISRHSTSSKSKSEKPKLVKNLDDSTLSDQSNLYGTMPGCPSVCSASEAASVFSEYMEDSLTPKTVKAVLVTTEAESAGMHLEAFLDNSHSEVSGEDYLFGKVENRNSVSDIPRSSPSINNRKERPSVAKTMSNQSLPKPGSPYMGGRYVSLREKASRQSISKDRKKMIDGALNASMSRLSLADEASVASLGWDSSVSSVLLDPMEGKI